MMKDYLETYNEQTKRSYAIGKTAEQFIPAGINHDSRFHSPYPLYFTKAQGCRVWDVDGNAYIDLWMAHYDAILGHAPTVITNKLKELLENGLHIGLPIEQEVELAERIVRMVPCAEQVRFCVTGTEATMFAVRLARGFTKKNTIIKMVGGWHGPNTDLMVDVRPPQFIGPEGAGLPPDLAKYTRSVQMNDIEGTYQVMQEVGDDLAGVIFEPAMGSVAFVAAQPTYLTFLREETKKRGALLIADEVITGFRLAPGGGQEVMQIAPDLVTLGKVLGGGMPIGAVAGKAEIMQKSAFAPGGDKREKVGIGGGTYSTNPLSMAAGNMTLDILESKANEIYPAIETRAKHLQESIEAVFAEVGILAKVNRTGSLFEVGFLKEKDAPLRNMADLVQYTDKARQGEFVTRMRTHGVFCLRAGAISIEHTMQDIDLLIEASRTVAIEMAESASN